MVGDHYFKKMEPWINPQPIQPGPYNPEGTFIDIFKPGITREEFDALKKEVKEMKEMLKKAKEIDKAMGLPDCENVPAKIAKLKELLKALGETLDGL